MLIVCPTCATSYTVEPASLGPAGRTVRCARCKESWFAGAPAAAVSDFVADVIAEAEARDTPASPHQDLQAADDFGHEPDQPAAHFPDAPSIAHDPLTAEAALPAQDAPPIVP